MGARIVERAARRTTDKVQHSVGIENRGLGIAVLHARREVQPILLVHRRPVFIPQAEVQSQVRAELPLVLDVSRVGAVAELAEIGGAGHEAGGRAGHVERLRGAADDAGQVRIQVVGGGEIRRADAREIGGGEALRVGAADSEGVSRYDARVVERRHVEKLPLETEGQLVLALEPVGVVLVVVGVHLSSLIEEGVHGAAEEQAGDDRVRVGVAVHERRIRAHKTAAHLVGQRRRGGPAPGQREQVVGDGVADRRHRGVERAQVRTVGGVIDVVVSAAKAVLRAQVIIAAIHELVAVLVVARVELVAAGVEPVAQHRGIGLRQLVDHRFHGRIGHELPQAGERLALDVAGGIAIRKDAVARAGREHRAIVGRLPLVAVQLVVGVEEQLVLDDAPAESGAGLVQIEKRILNPGLVVEPVVGSERAVAVVPVDRAVIRVGARLGGDAPSAMPLRLWRHSSSWWIR